MKAVLPDFEAPGSGDLLEELHSSWLQDPSSVDPAWAAWFSQLGSTEEPELTRQGSATNLGSVAQRNTTDDAARALADKQARVIILMRAYRDLGCLYADTNPLKGYLTPDMYYRLFAVEGDYGSLEPETYGLSQDDLGRIFQTGPFMKPEHLTLGVIIERLKKSYCSTIGIDVSHIQNRVIRRWIFERMEGELKPRPWTGDERRAFQNDLMRAEGFEHFLHQQYLGQKRFSLEGSEVLVPALNCLKALAARDNVGDIVLGMAHRGRLNILVNVLGKPLVDVFAKFEDAYAPHQFGGNGDVKYHMGWDSTWIEAQSGREIKLSLLANPSHLEAVDPVVEGRARALQRIRGDRNRKKILPVLLHGDSAFSGQGVVTETLNLSQLKGYRTGGTIHIVVNNQIGFTTAGRDSRSTFFASDTGRTIPMPILHVNGDDVEAVCQTMALALAFRQKFGMDVLVDIVCYRRHGHNETDEPSFTHPRMYQIIQERPSLPKLYGKELASQNIYPAEAQEAFGLAWRKELETEASRAKNGYLPVFDDAFASGRWKGYTRKYSPEPVDTALSRAKLDALVSRLHDVPAGFTVHPKLAKILGERHMLWKDGTSDWSLGEALAFASLLVEGHAVRLSGEDAQRGTFSHRHAVWWDHSSPKPRSWAPLSNLQPDQGVFAVYDSPLSEFSVLGFEYGYSLTAPDYLICWEAQFGDFANGAQVIIDQFITSGETKWFRSSGLVMLLPHGYEGQGPEHSSAHVDRYLARCADENIQVAYPGSPAQLFHLLRRQVLAPWRKPLIVFTPKSLLRNKACRSPVEDYTDHGFLAVLSSPADESSSSQSVLLCSGRVWYDLIAEKEKRKASGKQVPTIVRIDQLYPFPGEELAKELRRHGTGGSVTTIRWVQEENRNYGPWSFIREQFDLDPALKGLPQPHYVGRAPSPSPATGSHHQHEEELTAFLNEAFEDKE